jgi:hypothetical protein
MFCASCGKEQVVAGEYCPYCGAKVGVGISMGSGANSKNQVVSILLAFFLTFWTWLYTYKKDGWKFWLGLGLAVLALILGIAIAVAVPTEEGALGMLIWYIVGFGLWIWALVDVCVKKEAWYKNYS